MTNKAFTVILKLSYFIANDVIFHLKDQRQHCFYQPIGPKPRNYVEGQRYVCDLSFGNLKWLWTKHNQLLNTATLQCMSVRNTTSLVVMQKCDRDDKQQRWKCVGNKNYNIVNKKSGKYLTYARYGRYITTKHGPHDATQWMRHRTIQPVCSQGEIIHK